MAGQWAPKNACFCPPTWTFSHRLAFMWVLGLLSYLGSLLFVHILICVCFCISIHMLVWTAVVEFWGGAFPSSNLPLMVQSLVPLNEKPAALNFYYIWNVCVCLSVCLFLTPSSFCKWFLFSPPTRETYYCWLCLSSLGALPFLLPLFSGFLKLFLLLLVVTPVFLHFNSYCLSQKPALVLHLAQK